MRRELSLDGQIKCNNVKRYVGRNKYPDILETSREYSRISQLSNLHIQGGSKLDDDGSDNQYIFILIFILFKHWHVQTLGLYSTFLKMQLCRFETEYFWPKLPKICVIFGTNKSLIYQKKNSGYKPSIFFKNYILCPLK